MEFLAEYGLFFAKVFTVVVAVLIILAALAAQAVKGKLPGQDGQVEVKKINKLFDEIENKLKEAVLSEADYKKLEQEKKKQLKKEKKNKSPDTKPNVFVIEFDGDVKASAVENLRQEITAVLTTATDKDEVVLNVESPGGMVHTYGLAASQLQRLRSAGIPLTICVDKVAASGGYLMACVGNKILAAPFALVGSIGVLAQIPNFNKVLRKFDVDYEVMTAGEYKAPITMFGEITDKGKNKLKEELEETHVLFKNFIEDHRPQVPLDEVATGEVWYGQKAIEKQLVDEITTSDDYLLSLRNTHNIFQVQFVEKKSLQEKLGLNIQYGVKSAIEAILDKNTASAVTKDIS